MMLIIHTLLVMATIGGPGEWLPLHAFPMVLGKLWSQTVLDPNCAALPASEDSTLFCNSLQHRRQYKPSGSESSTTLAHVRESGI